MRGKAFRAADLAFLVHEDDGFVLRVDAEPPRANGVRRVVRRHCGGWSVVAHVSSTCWPCSGTVQGQPELLLDAPAQRVGRGRLAVGDERHPWRRLEAFQPAQDFVGVGVGGQHVEILHLGAHRHVGAVNLDAVGAADHGAPRVPPAWKPANRIVLRGSGA